MAVPLSLYVNMIHTTRTVSPPGYPYHPRLVLTEQVQHLLRRVLHKMPDSRSQTNNQCLSGLNAGNIWVDVESGIPFLDGVVWTGYDANLAQMNYRSLERIFRENIFNGVVPFLPPDFKQLLCLMRTEGHVLSYTIQHHCSLVLAMDKKELFTRLYNYSYDILRWQDRPSYEYVINNLVFPPDWNSRIQQNLYLDMFYRKSNYHPVGPNAGKEVLRFKRNTYSHPLEHAWDRRTGKQMYDQAELGEMLETELPLVLHSFQVALDRRGQLRPTRLETLFR